MMRVRCLHEGPQAALSASAVFSRSLLQSSARGTWMEDPAQASLCEVVLDKERAMTDHASMDVAGEWQKSWVQRGYRAVRAAGRA